MNRRNIIRGAFLVPVAVALNACGFLNSKAVQTVQNVDMTKVAADVSTLAGVVTAVKGALGSLKGIPAGVSSTVTRWISDAQNAAAKVTAAASSVAAQIPVTAIGNDLAAIEAAVKPYMPASWATVFSDAATVLGVVKTAIGIASLVALAPMAEDVDAARARLATVAAAGMPR